eukprot:3381768-Alexandrium_andersonii.AAC.1
MLTVELHGHPSPIPHVLPPAYDAGLRDFTITLDVARGVGGGRPPLWSPSLPARVRRSLCRRLCSPSA